MSTSSRVIFVLFALQKGFLISNAGPTQNFYNTILSKYSNEIPPWDDRQFQVVVNFSVPFSVLATMEENKQLLGFISKINVSWHDPRLEFDPKKIGRAMLQIPSSKLWMPTFEVYNAMDVTQMDKLQEYYEAQVLYNGHVSMLWIARFDTICQLALDSFPFDYQLCSLSFSCGLAPYEQVRSHTIAIEDDFRVGSPEWQMLPAETEDYSYYSMGRNQSISRYTYKLQRNPQFYIYFLIIPTYIITATCLAALLFPMKLQIGEKINLGLAGLLGLTFMLSVIVQELPRMTGLPLMGKWLLLQIFFCVIALSAHVPSYYIHLRYRKYPDKEKIWNYVIMMFFLIAHSLVSILLFVFPPTQPDPSEYKTL